MKTRVIKQTFFLKHELYKAEFESKLPLRLSYLGLISICDDMGRFPWKPEEIKLKIIPYDNEIDFNLVLEKLERLDLIAKRLGHTKVSQVPKNGVLVNKDHFFDTINIPEPQ